MSIWKNYKIKIIFILLVSILLFSITGLSFLSSTPAEAVVVCPSGSQSQPGCDYGDIQSAISSLGQGGGLVHLRPGIYTATTTTLVQTIPLRSGQTYKIYAAFVVPSDVSIEGEGDGTIIRLAGNSSRPDSERNIFQSFPVSKNISISKLRIEGNSSRQQQYGSNAVITGVSFDACLYCFIDNVTFDDIGGADASWAVSIDQNDLPPYEFSKYGRVTNSRFFNVATVAIYADNASQNLFADNVFTGGCKSSCIRLHKASSQNTVSRNQIQSVEGIGVLVFGGGVAEGPVTGNVIEANHISDAMMGIAILGGIATARNHSIIANEVVRAASDGIYLSNTRVTTLVGNMVTGSKEWDLEIGSTASSTTVLGGTAPKRLVSGENNELIGVR